MNEQAGSDKRARKGGDVVARLNRAVETRHERRAFYQTDAAPTMDKKKENMLL